MSVHEQEEVKMEHYSEAMRYMDNAKEYLKSAQKEDNYYQDIKYVRTACGTAYSGLLVALEGFMKIKGYAPKGKDRKSIEYYQRNITKIDKKMLNKLINAYQVLHLWGYYDGIMSVNILKEGFEEAYDMIEKIRPKNIVNN